MIKAIDLVKRFEGCRLHPYLDVAGIPTIGYGAIYRLDGSRVEITDERISQETADLLLARDVEHSLASVARLCAGASLTSSQAAALADFTYNLGTGTLQHSTLRQMVLMGEFGMVPAQFRRYVFAGGRKVNGLVNRREAEIEVWNERGF